MTKPDARETAQLDMIFEVAAGHEVHAVAERLRAAGVAVDRELRMSRVVSGKVSAARLEELGRIAGVGNARASEAVQLPPFSEDVPQ